MKIETATADHYAELISVWEASVRATHHFLPEEYLQVLKLLILTQYFDAVELRCARTTAGRIAGFIGVADGSVEMLFIDPVHRHQGLGRRLLTHAITHQAAIRVDVNEQNPEAVGFYSHMGFELIGRSALDGMGEPFPLLHMALKPH